MNIDKNSSSEPPAKATAPHGEISERHTAIHKLMENGKIQNIEQLLEQLQRKYKIKTSKPTLSRDLKKLNYKKDEDFYFLDDSADEKTAAYIDFLSSQVRNINDDIQLVAIKTKRGHGRGASVALEHLFRRRLFGTISGDDMTILAFRKKRYTDDILAEIYDVCGFEPPDKKPPITKSEE